MLSIHPYNAVFKCMKQNTPMKQKYSYQVLKFWKKEYMCEIIEASGGSNKYRKFEV